MPGPYGERLFAELFGPVCVDGDLGGVRPFEGQIHDEALAVARNIIEVPCFGDGPALKELLRRIEVEGIAGGMTESDHDAAAGGHVIELLGIAAPARESAAGGGDLHALLGAG